MKSSATAYPIQGLIKYHGLKDERLRIPYHDSISVCTAPLMTHTTIEFGYDEDTSSYDGKVASPHESQRILDVVDSLRELAGERSRFRMVSRTIFNRTSDWERAPQGSLPWLWRQRRRLASGSA